MTNQTHENVELAACDLAPKPINMLRHVFFLVLASASWAAPRSRPAALPQRAGRASSACPRRCRCPWAPAGPALAGSPAPRCCGPSWSPRPAAPYWGSKLRAALVGALKAPASSGLDAAVGQILVVLELVRVVLQQPELGGRPRGSRAQARDIHTVPFTRSCSTCSRRLLVLGIRDDVQNWFLGWILMDGQAISLGYALSP